MSIIISSGYKSHAENSSVAESLCDTDQIFPWLSRKGNSDSLQICPLRHNHCMFSLTDSCRDILFFPCCFSQRDHTWGHFSRVDAHVMLKPVSLHAAALPVCWSDLGHKEVKLWWFGLCKYNQGGAEGPYGTDHRISVSLKLSGIIHLESSAEEGSSRSQKKMAGWQWPMIGKHAVTLSYNSNN